MAFREENESVKQLLKELLLLRELKAQHALPFSEAALTLMTLERFLRILPGVNAADKESLPQLLQRAVALKLLELPGGMEVVDEVRRFRNSLLHANYEQAAKTAGANSVEDFFRNHFAKELEFLFALTTSLVRQVDPVTGLRRS